MALTPTSLLSCMISSALFTVLAWLIIKSDSILRVVGRYICIFLAAIVIRIALPVEFGFTVTFFSKHVLTRLRDFMVLEMKFGKYNMSIGQTLVFLWIVGAIALFLICIGGYIYFSHIIGKCPGYFQHDMESVIRRINKEYGKEKKFEVLLVPCIQTPAVFGVIQPKILMPVTDYTAKEIYYILKHEMLHYYQHDILVKILCEILCIIYWWNPAVFLLKKLLARIIEIRVDCLLTSKFSDEEKIGYMQCIVKSMKTGEQEKISLMITFVAQKGEAIKQRFNCIWENHWIEKRWKGFFVAVVSCLLLLISVSFIVEPWYEGDIPGTFGYPDLETSYLVETSDGYEVYIDEVFVGEVLEITEPYMELEVYKRKKDLSNAK